MEIQSCSCSLLLVFLEINEIRFNFRDINSCLYKVLYVCEAWFFQLPPKIYFMVCTSKAVPATFLVVCFSSLKESTQQTSENVFYFTSEVVFVLIKIKF